MSGHAARRERIFGIDPGMASVGLAVVDRDGSTMRAVWYGCMRTDAASSVDARLATIHHACSQVIERFEPDSMAIEEMYPGASPQAAMGVGQARGVCILACALAGVPVTEYSPTAIKRAVTGFGKAEKDQMQRMVQRILQLAELPRPDHAADALGIAICHGGSLRVPAGA